MPLQFQPNAYFSAWQTGRKAEEPKDPTPMINSLANGLNGFANISAKKDAAKLALIKARQDKAIPLAKDLTDNGLHPDEVSNVVNNFIQTGQLDIPSMRSKIVGSVDGVGPISNGTEPVKYGKAPKKNAIYGFDEAKGTWTTQDVPDDTTPKVFHYNSQKPTGRYGAAQKDPKQVSTSDLRAVINSYGRMIEAMVPGTDTYNNAIEELRPYQDEMKARLDKGSVRTPDEKKTAASSAIRAKASKYLTDRKYPVTDANIQALIDKEIIK